MLVDTEYLPGPEAGPGEPWESLEKLSGKDNLLLSSCRSQFTTSESGQLREWLKGRAPESGSDSNQVSTYRLCAPLGLACTCVSIG